MGVHSDWLLLFQTEYKPKSSFLIEKQKLSGDKNEII